MFTFILGTKAELIKCMPLMKELRRRRIEYTFVHTGHHSLDEMCAEFKIKRPDMVLFRPPKRTSKFFLRTGKALGWGLSLSLGLLKTFRKIRGTKFVLVHGDTITTATAAILSSSCPHRTWKTVHLEAGLRSHNLFEPFPEEIHRRVADRFSHILFAVSELARENLRREGVRGKIYHVGNTIVDSVNICLRRRKRSKRRGHVLINLHRNENLQSKMRMQKIVKIINSISLKMYWPIHDQTLYALRLYGLWKEVEKNENIEFSPLVPYIDFLQELRSSKFVVTDGGSIQEECLVLEKPCLILRMATERAEGLKTGINFLTRLNIEYSKRIIKLLEGEFKLPPYKNPYGYEGCSKRIINHLMAMD
jgi:UDP-N-acetylglucosamine 2-epimerase (non-hydrolysing)